MRLDYLYKLTNPSSVLHWEVAFVCIGVLMFASFLALHLAFRGERDETNDG